MTRPRNSWMCTLDMIWLSSCNSLSKLLVECGFKMASHWWWLSWQWRVGHNWWLLCPPIWSAKIESVCGKSRQRILKSHARRNAQKGAVTATVRTWATGSVKEARVNWGNWRAVTTWTLRLKVQRLAAATWNARRRRQSRRDWTRSLSKPRTSASRALAPTSNSCSTRLAVGMTSSTSLESTA